MQITLKPFQRPTYLLHYNAQQRYWDIGPWRVYRRPLNERYERSNVSSRRDRRSAPTRRQNDPD